MKKNTGWMDLFWLTLGIALLFGFMLGCRALSVPDEARYTEIPREMLWFHDFVTPHLDGVKYFEKPPLLYWMQAGVIALWGIHEWALRLPTALMGLLGCLACYVSGRQLFDRATGLCAAGVLATSPLYFSMAHSITLDMSVTLWLTLTLFAFMIAVDLPWHSPARRYVAWLIYIAAALAVLTKGLIGIALPGLIIFSWLLLFNRWRELSRLHLPSGIFIFLLITLPWHILVQIKNPEFFHFYFVEQHFTRYLTKAMGRYQPFWWFVPILALGLFPWIFFLPQALFKSFKPKEVFLLLWAVEIFVFFSFSDSKLIPYILPVFPPLALFIGRYLASLEYHEKSMSISIQGIAIFAFMVGLGLLGAQYWHHVFTPQQLRSLHFIAIPWFAMSIGTVLINRSKIKLLWIIAMQVILLGSLVAAVPQFDLRPIKSLALQAKAMIAPNDIVASYDAYYQDLPVYLQRLVLIVDWKNELTFGYTHQASAKEIMLGTGEFWKLWNSPTRVFAFMDQEDYQRNKAEYKMYLLATQGDNVFISNQPTITQRV